MLQELDASEGDKDESRETTNDSTPGSKQKPNPRSYMVGRVALRTVFFDTKLLDAVTSGPPAAIKQVRSGQRFSARGSSDLQCSIE